MFKKQTVSTDSRTMLFKSYKILALESSSCQIAQHDVHHRSHHKAGCGYFSTMDKFLGPVLLGVTASYFIFGLTTQQIFMYFHQFPKDEKWMKFSVALIWALNACVILPQMFSLYQILIVHFGDIEAVRLWFGWPVTVHNSIAVAIILLVQLLYTNRLWRLSKGKGCLCYIIFIWILIDCALAIVMAYHTSRLTLTSLTSLWSVECVLTMAMVTDMVIAVSMCYHLQKSKSALRNSRYNSKVSKLMLYTVGSGMLTSVLALATLIVYVIFPKHLTFFYVLCPYILLYGLSYLTLLNARESSRHEEIERGCQAEKMCTPYNGPSSVALDHPIHS